VVYVYDKKHLCWLWHAIDHCSSEVLAYTFGMCECCVLEELFLLLKPFGISRVYADGNCAYEKILGVDKVSVGMRSTQKIECKDLSLCTWVKRLVRKTICFSSLFKCIKQWLVYVLT